VTRCAGFAGHVAGSLLAGSLEEATGFHWHELEQMSAAELGRLNWAVEEVARRLHRMGPKPK
jgi:hypothetical protein